MNQTASNTASNPSAGLVQPPLARRSVQVLMACMVATTFAAQLAISITQTDPQDNAPGMIVDTADIQIDLNQAEMRELSLLPSVGPVLAQRIMDDRVRRGPYQSVRDLQRVHGIGEKTLLQLDQICYVQTDSQTH